jgi:hypothetical protein
MRLGGTPLRLAWHNPAALAASGARAALVLLPPPAPLPPAVRVAAGRRLDLAVAIEIHLSGHDGLSDGEFVDLFARGRAAR